MEQLVPVWGPLFKQGRTRPGDRAATVVAETGASAERLDEAGPPTPGDACDVRPPRSEAERTPLSPRTRRSPRSHAARASITTGMPPEGASVMLRGTTRTVAPGAARRLTRDRIWAST